MKKKRFNCPAEMTVSLVGGKWKLILIYNLRLGSKRFGQLRRLSPGITPTTLARQLKDLEHDGIVERHDTMDGSLPAVEYQLTEKGQSLRPILNAMVNWGLAHKHEHVLGDFGMASFKTRSRS